MASGMENASQMEDNLQNMGENNNIEEKSAQRSDRQQEEKNRYFEKLDANAKKRLDYLLEQAEIYSHFLSKDNASKKNDGRRQEQGNKPKKRKMQYKSEENDIEEVQKSVYLTESPSFIKGVMRDYQIDGLNWLVSLGDRGINGILADDMGLGKTLQTVSLLGFLKHFKNIKGPHLVVAPLSTVLNWKREFEKFCPSISSFILAGPKEERQILLKEKMREHSWDVCITSYEICRIEQSAFRKIAWRYIVIDEAHRIKNEKALLSIALRTFTSTNRLLLTGTPLQNDLHELWSLLNYLLPDVFNSADDFDKWFDPTVCLGDEDMVNRLHRILKPFMLRRIKAEVEKTLLPKIETKIFVGLSKLQREWYRKVLLKDIMIMRNGWEPQKMRLDNLWMHLRKAANHPYLFEGAEEGPPYIEGEHLIQNSGKMIILDKLLSKLKAQGSKVLLFSQFKIVLNILEDYCSLRNHEYYRLDGDTDYETRSANMDAFNEGTSSTFIFMISTRAGGLGITLTGADCVIVFDSDCNPQADLQAIDRAHRIGQTKQVRVFRLITANTIDEKIVEIAERKMRLDRLVIQQGRMVDNKALTAEEKLAIMKHGANYVLSSTESDLIDEDIDKILARSEIKTAELKTMYDKMGEAALQNFKIETEPINLNTFEGIDFRELRKKEDNLILDRPRRCRNPVNTKIRNTQYRKKDARYKKWMETLADNFQLHPKPSRIRQLLDKENAEEISADESRELRQLQRGGFHTWSFDQFRGYIDAVREFGRDDDENISMQVAGKTPSQVIEYHKAFWYRGQRDYSKFNTIKERLDRARQKSQFAKADDPDNAHNTFASTAQRSKNENASSYSSYNYKCSTFTSSSSTITSSSSTTTSMKNRILVAKSSQSQNVGVFQSKAKPEWLSTAKMSNVQSKPAGSNGYAAVKSSPRGHPQFAQSKSKPEWLVQFPRHVSSGPSAVSSGSTAKQFPNTQFAHPKSQPGWLAPAVPSAFTTDAHSKSIPTNGVAVNSIVATAAVSGVQQKRKREEEPIMVDGLLLD